MKERDHLFYTVLLLSILIQGTIGNEVIIAVSYGTLGALLALGFYNQYNCVHEACDGYCIALNATGLKYDLETKLFGQHIAAKVILQAVTGFMTNNNPRKPLVLSIHGSTGTGKNFVSHLIAQNLYKKGMSSSFVHLFTATGHFPHAVHLNIYKNYLQEQIKRSVMNCPHSVFIFDEMDKMDSGLIDSIEPFLDINENLNGVSYRRAIFIFLSNTGGDNIAQVAFDFWKAGRKREEIQPKDLEMTLFQSVFKNEHSGFLYSSLIPKNLVDFFVPFLPLEHKHILQCGLAELYTRGLGPNIDVVEKMACDLNYFPKEQPVFSVKGCKTIHSRLDLYI